MDADLSARLDALEKKIDAVHASADSARKMLVWTIILAVAVTALPLIGMAFILPSLLAGYASVLGM